MVLNWAAETSRGDRNGDRKPARLGAGVGAFKSAMDAIRTVVELIRSSRSNDKTPSSEEQAQIDRAIAEADKLAKIADAQTAKALGFELCHCKFPPVAMLTVGFLDRRADAGKPVHECPQCGRLTSGPFSYHRTVPERLP
jgi:hypothetical protein